MSKKTYKEKLWKTDRDRQIEKAVELSKYKPRPINPKIRKEEGEEE